MTKKANKAEADQSALADKSQRDRMSGALNANIAVRAAAGSGKTRSTVDRIVAMALDPDYRQYLPQLVVVTYTNAAADELRTRARKRLIEEHHAELKHLAGEIIPKFGQIFFGTIHSFCMRILREFGHQIGLPSQLESIEDQVDEIHERFRRDQENEVWELLDRSEALRTFRFGLSFENLVQIGKELSMLPLDCAELALLPEIAEFDVLREGDQVKLDPAALDGCKVRVNSEQNIRRYQKKYREFCRSWNSRGEDGSFISMLGLPKKGGKDLKERSEEVLAGAHNWYARSVLKLGLGFAARFQAYRWEKGCLTFNDQILLASRLVAKPDVLRTLRGRNLRVILDEAQDTTPAQFRILSEITRPVDSGFADWPGSAQGFAVASPEARRSGAKPALEKAPLPPRPGHFVMVGDEQQCIYASSGAEIECYTKHGGALESVIFHVTFRCSRTVVRFVNERFPKILHGDQGQARFVELISRQGAGEGAIGRLIFGATIAPAPGKKITAAMRFEKEAELLAQEVKKLGPAGLGARRWSEVAILMPRNEWLNILAGHLERAGVPCRLTARRKNRSAAAWRWFTALLVVLAGHDNGYELAGVMREIFGIPDSEMAAWVFSGRKISLNQQADSSRIGTTLKLLQDLARKMDRMPALMAVDEMMRATAIVRRVASLRDIRAVSCGPATIWSMLRGEAADAEAKGISWREWAGELLARDQIDLPELLPADGRDAIVLMTCQKAKGQEWPIVLLAGLSRPLRPPPTYKNSIEVLTHGGAFAWRAKGIRTRNWREVFEANAAQREHEMRRIYYVACTRAKKYLILADTRKIWPGESTLTRPIQALSAPQEFDTWLDGVELWKAPAFEREAARAEREAELLAADLKSIAQIAAPKILHPSRSDQDRSASEIEQQEERGGQQLRVEPLHGALIYGDWWHKLMFKLDLSSPKLREEMLAAVDELPGPVLRARGREEIQMLSRSGFWRELLSEQRETRRELAYSRIPEANAIEDGKIDLLYRDGEHWSLLDWKTDAVSDPSQAVERARKQYSAQISAYCDALGSFGVKIRQANLYFTAIGELTPVPISPKR